MSITPTSHEFAVLADAMKSQGHWLFLRVQICNEYKSDNFVGLSRTDDNQLYLQSMLRYHGDAYRSTTGQDEAGWKREWELVDDSVNSPRQFIGHDCGVFVITNITFLAQKIPSTAQTYTEAIFLEQNTRERMHFSSGLPPVKKIVPPSPDYTTKTDEAGNCRSIDVQPAKRGKQSIFNIHHNKICVLCT